MTEREIQEFAMRSDKAWQRCFDQIMHLGSMYDRAKALSILSIAISAISICGWIVTIVVFMSK